ncbi:ABC transporter permease [Thermasporomyces composti]|uniref:Ribose transport system permease protein/erythritol transport system permease protein n=1 Tax=Thermasporomyces composti TaxID=696763 RepID=A0A3D9V7B2_THECX|nr:ABC transporter permease [Thermasporomyces composti]REF37688.1 ribose transport system permease protein/erythritol transport system permease protein [Thermasporomyces composti]
MTAAESTTNARERARLAQLLEYLLTERAVLLAVLLVGVLVWFKVLEAGQYLVAPYDLGYLASALESLVPLCLLALAELLVIVSGRGGIDLSVGAIVSLAGMVFGFCVAGGWPVPLAILVCLVTGTLLGAVNGVLTAYLRFPPLIATLATYYAYSSLAMVSNDRAPISTEPVQRLSALTRPIDVFGLYVPRHVFTILLPCLVVVWLVVNRSTYGRKLYAVGTNDVAATFAALSVARVRLAAYTGAGLLAGVVAVVTVAQFASARPDAGTVGNGMALPAITIAVLGGVAIQGGIGTVGGVAMAALLVTWLNAGLLLAFEGSEGSQYQLLALGVVLVGSALLNTISLRRYG